MNYDLGKKNGRGFHWLRHNSYFMIHNSTCPPRILTRGGQVALTAVFFFLVASTIIVFGVFSPVLRHIQVSDNYRESSGSLYTAESLSEDLLYRIKNGLAFGPSTPLSLNGVTAVATTTTVFDGKEVVVSGTSAGSFVRTLKVHAVTGAGAAFNYGVQSGAGGIALHNSSSVIGNLFSNGPITGDSSNLIKGDVISAGPSGSISGIHATSSAYAHAITNSTIDKDAYYVTISNTTVGGASHSGSADQATSTLPISDAQVSVWEGDAANGGTISSPCPYQISSNATLGPKKIACDLEITGSPIVTIAGAVWVVGNITIKNSATLRVDPSIGNKSVPVIADDPANRATGGTIAIQNSTQFLGNGPQSYVLLLSQNNSAEQGGNTKAIDMQNSSNGGDLLLYAGHGLIELGNSASLKEVTGYQLSLKNSATVTYITGLANLLFTSGPGGGFMFDVWREVQ